MAQGSEPPTWNVDVVFDKPALGPEQQGRSSGVAALFVDAEELLLFADQNFARLTVDGDVLETIPYPFTANPESGEPAILSQVARGVNGFAGVFFFEKPFCIFDKDGRTSVEKCRASPYGILELPRWVQGHYQVISRSEHRPSVFWAIDEAGGALAARESELREIAGYELLEEVNVIITRHRQFDSSCDVRVSVEPLDAGTLSDPTSVLPTDYQPNNVPVTAASSTEALALYQGRCRDSETECTSVNGDLVAWFGAIVRDDGRVEGPISYSEGTLRGRLDLIWDGEYFVALDLGLYEMTIVWLDGDGQVVAKGVAFEDAGIELGGPTGFAAIAPSDYFVAYHSYATGTRVRRVRVALPAQP